jgi:hypothetical protein
MSMSKECWNVDGALGEAPLSSERSALVLRSLLVLAFLLANPMGRKCLICLQTLIQRIIRTNEERSTSAQFLTGWFAYH